MTLPKPTHEARVVDGGPECCGGCGRAVHGVCYFDFVDGRVTCPECEKDEAEADGRRGMPHVYLGVDRAVKSS